MNNKKVYLTLQNGKTFVGKRFGANGESVGELVFTTGVVGYVETLTDPSFYGQVVVQTFPTIGNYGVAPEDAESDKAYLSAYVVREVCEIPSNFRSQGTLDDYLKKMGVIGVYGIDTRELTKIIRENGSMNVAITDKPLSDLSVLKTNTTAGALEKVSCKNVEYFGDENGVKVAVWDFGVKNSIIENLTKRGCRCIKVPYNTDADEILSLDVKGVVLSNGPGNPAENCSVIENVKKVLGKVPVFGIGFGHQLVALAMGGMTNKMERGHRGANQPVKELSTGKTYTTSQNHGYDVVVSSIEKIAKVDYVSVNDGSCEGCEYKNVNAVTVQFDPTECGGARGTTFFYDNFVNTIKGGNN